MSSRILLADDHNIVRFSITNMLTTNQYSVVGEAQDIPELKDKLLELTPDILITDYDMPGGDLLNLLNDIKRHQPELKIIVLTGITSVSVLTRIVGSKANIDGLLMKKSSFEELETAINAIKCGQQYIQAQIKQLIADADHNLTKREIDVLCLLREGKTSKEIADILHLSNKTVDNYRLHIMKKFNAKNAVELIAIARKKGIF